MRMTDLPTDFSIPLPDERGHFGPYGGVFVAETLMRALDELKAQYARYRRRTRSSAPSSSASSSTTSAGRRPCITPSAGRASWAARRSGSSART